MRSLFLGLAAIALIACLAPNALAQVQLVNSDFSEEVPSNGQGGGWESSNIDGGGGWFVGRGRTGAAFRLNDNGKVASDPTIQQVVGGFMPGATYTVYGFYRLGVAGGQPNNSFEVRIDGATVLSIGPDPTHVQFQNIWALFQAEFVATSDTHTVQFAAEANGSDHDYYIDDISFTRAVPLESTSWGRVKAGF